MQQVIPCASIDRIIAGTAPEGDVVIRQNDVDLVAIRSDGRPVRSQELHGREAFWHRQKTGGAEI